MPKIKSIYSFFKDYGKPVVLYFRGWRLSASLAVGSMVVATTFAAVHPVTAHAVDLGIEGQIYETIEEDFRIMLMRLIARTDLSGAQEELKQSALDYTKNLPSYYLPRADKTVTRWKDVGVVTAEDINLPYYDMQEGSVFEPEMRRAIRAGQYVNPIAQLPAAGIDRLFIFDATDPDQLSQAKALMRLKIPLLNFMTIAGDLGPISTEMNMPVYHPIPTLLDKFHVRAVPTLIGFGRGEHQGHMAITEFSLPVTVDKIRSAWFGYGDKGEPPNFIDAPPRVQLKDLGANFSNLTDTPKQENEKDDKPYETH